MIFETCSTLGGISKLYGLQIRELQDPDQKLFNFQLYKFFSYPITIFKHSQFDRDGKQMDTSEWIYHIPIYYAELNEITSIAASMIQNLIHNKCKEIMKT